MADAATQVRNALSEHAINPRLNDLVYFFDKDGKKIGYGSDSNIYSSNDESGTTIIPKHTVSVVTAGDFVATTVKDLKIYTVGNVHITNVHDSVIFSQSNITVDKKVQNSTLNADGDVTTKNPPINSTIIESHIPSVQGAILQDIRVAAQKAATQALAVAKHTPDGAATTIDKAVADNLTASTLTRDPKGRA